MKLLKSTMPFAWSVIILLTACQTEENIAPEPAPEMPPIESMEMNFSNFQEGNTGGRVEASDNWGHAVFHVAVWNTVLAVNLVIPVSAFRAAISQQATYDADNDLWRWTYDHNVVGRTYSSELTAKIVADGIEWKMFVSQESGFQNVLWYSGIMAMDGSSGYWELNRDGNNPIAYLRIDWEKQGDEIGNIKYTSIESNADLNGSYIEYAQTASADFNRSYDIYIDKTSNLVEIEWHSDEGNGRIKNPNFYGDNNFRCWNTSFEDVDC